ncbi:hypothetical protein JCM3765_006591 [Sporobolomyces pararoseus]
MCKAKAALVYGLTVRSSSLLFAADAWSRLKLSLPFFQLVYLRCRKGGLVTGGSIVAGPVTRVPDEAWEQVRLSLIQQELVDSQIKFLEPLLCNRTDCAIKATSRDEIRWELLKDIDGCEECIQYGIGEFVRNSIANWYGSEGMQVLTVIKSLVSDFGLALPTYEPISIGPEWTDEPEALVLIGAPTTFETGSSENAEITAECGGDPAYDEPTIIEASFKLPRDIKTRFERLIKLFGLEVVNSLINKLSPRSASNTKEMEKEKGKQKKQGKAQVSGVQNEVTKKIKPRWKLWTMCEYTL